LISLVDAQMGIAILPVSAVKHGVASVKAADGTEQTFEVAGHGTKVAAVDTAKGTEKGAKVTVYYTERAARKLCTSS
jgi:hypothetical protein